MTSIIIDEQGSACARTDFEKAIYVASPWFASQVFTSFVVGWNHPASALSGAVNCGATLES
jgi:hypothetical protein